MNYKKNQKENYDPLKNNDNKISFIIKDNFNLLKILLSHLIASKDTQNLIFALFLTYKFRKSFNSNYEISLIHLFLCRLFLFHKEVSKLFNEFNIKNNQFYSLFFIWSDLAIILNLKDKSKEEDYLKLIEENLKTVEKTLKHFIEKNKIGHAVSLIKVHKKLKNEIVLKEIKNKKILSKESKTLFSELLGKGCEYLFSKVCKGEGGGKVECKVGKGKVGECDSKGDDNGKDADNSKNRDYNKDKDNNKDRDGKVDGTLLLKTLFLAPFEYQSFTSLLNTPLGKIEDSEFIEWFKSGINSI